MSWIMKEGLMEQKGIYGRGNSMGKGTETIDF